MSEKVNWQHRGETQQKEMQLNQVKEIVILILYPHRLKLSLEVNICTVVDSLFYNLMLKGEYPLLTNVSLVPGDSRVTCCYRKNPGHQLFDGQVQVWIN